MIFVLSTIDLISSTSALLSQWWLNRSIYYIWLLARNESIAWACCFAHSLWSFTKRADNLVSKERFWSYLIITILVVCLWTFSIGKLEGLRDLPATISYSVPSVVGVLICSSYYILLYVTLRRQTSSSIIFELLRFPLILICCNVYFVTFFFSDRDGEDPWWIKMWEVCFNLQGLFNALAYALAIKMWDKSKEKCRRRKSNMNELSDALANRTTEFTSNETPPPSFVIYWDFSFLFCN